MQNYNNGVSMNPMVK